MIIYPAIDIKDGQCVRLVQGRAEEKTVYSDRPADVARSFQEQGAAWLHVVDLDGAFCGSPQNQAAIREIAAAIQIPFQVGGGLRSQENVESILAAGARRVIIGTRAVSHPDFIEKLVEKFGPDRIILGLDARDGLVAVEGWVSTSALSTIDFGQQMKNLGVTTAVYTDVARDGLLQGPNLESTLQIARQTGLKIIASGGVSTVENIKALKDMEEEGVVGVIVGKALYDGKLELSQALKAAL